MEILRIIEARIARWMAYSDYCMNAGFELPRCRTFWIWAGILGLLAAAGIIGYAIRQARAGRRMAVHSDGSNSAE